MNELATLIHSLVRLPTPADNKYTRGVLGFVTGSNEYPGAALLGVQAAESVGLGMVRYVGPTRVADLILLQHPQVLVNQEVTENPKADAWVLGSGVPGTDDVQVANIRAAAAAAHIAVLDAGAIEVLDFEDHREKSFLLTPHLGEFSRLLDRLKIPFEKSDLELVQGRSDLAQRASVHIGQAILLKGSMTLLAQPGSPAIPIGPNSPHLASAGTGDVLAGVIGALAATNPNDARSGWQEIAQLAVGLHSQAAQLAAAQGPVVASVLSSKIFQIIQGEMA